MAAQFGILVTILEVEEQFLQPWEHVRYFGEETILLFRDLKRPTRITLSDVARVA